MAIFVARAEAGSEAAVPTAYTDPGTGRSYDCAIPGGLHFTDITTAMSYCKHTHYLWARAVVDGCTASPAKYCPASLVNRPRWASSSPTPSLCCCTDRETNSAFVTSGWSSSALATTRRDRAGAIIPEVQLRSPFSLPTVEGRVPPP